MPEFTARSLILYMVIACFLIPFLHVALIRITKNYGESALPLLISCGVGFICWLCIVIYALVLKNFGVDLKFLASLVTSLFIYCGFVLGYLEFFSLINRGYSLSIMMDVSRRSSPPTITQLEQEYAGGLGLRWMLTKRVRGLVSLKFVNVDDSKIVLNKGWPTNVARILEKAKIFFSIKGSG